MDFSRVLVTDRLAWEIFGVAARESCYSFRAQVNNHHVRGVGLLVNGRSRYWCCSTACSFMTMGQAHFGCRI